MPDKPRSRLVLDVRPLRGSPDFRRLWTGSSLSVIGGQTIVQVATPDRFRGRITGVDFVIGAGGPQLGNFRAGAVGSLTSPAVSAVGGGLATVLGAGLIGLLVPGLVRYRAPASGETD